MHYQVKDNYLHIWIPLLAVPKAKKRLALLHVTMTPREAQILQGIKDGLQNKEIASLHMISVYTVKRYVSNILAKAKVTTRRELELFSADVSYHGKLQ